MSIGKEPETTNNWQWKYHWKSRKKKSSDKQQMKYEKLGDSYRTTGTSESNENGWGWPMDQPYTTAISLPQGKYAVS